MADLSEMQEEYKESVASATHLLLIGQSKMGKSDYVAQAAKDGFDIIYWDRDNGLPTLLEALDGDDAALKRVHYFRPENMTATLLAFFKNGKFIYNERTRKVYASHEAKPDDKLTIMYAGRLMKHRNVVVSIDSWTSWCLSALEDAAKKNKVELTSIDKYGREIYGPSGFYMTQMGTIIQLAPFNVIVQAHPAVYEIKERPPGSEAREVKEPDMIIRDTWEIPMSTSAPHGYSIGKFFNQIGWMELDRFGKYVLSFKAKSKRLVGGTVKNKEGDPRTTMRFKTLFGGGLELPQPMPEDRPWLERTTVAEYQESIKSATPAATAKPATTPALNTKPAQKLGGLKLG